MKGVCRSYGEFIWEISFRLWSSAFERGISMVSSYGERDGLKCLFGRIALNWGCVTSEQIEECVDEQERIRAEHSGEKDVHVPPLGEMLVKKGHINWDKREEILTFQEAMLSNKLKDGESSLSEMLMGQVALDKGLIKRGQLENALSIQARDIEKGKHQRLGKIMMDLGYLTPENVLTLLGLQNRTLVICTACGTKFNAEGYSQDKHFICKNCGSSLEVCTNKDDVVADETLAFEILTPPEEDKPEPVDSAE